MKSYDPLMHTTEHILNQTMDNMFACGRSFNAHIERKKSKCDYRLDKAPSQQEMDAVVQKVNEMLRQNLQISEHFVSKLDAEDKYDTGKLPDDVQEPIRIVTVGDYDACPCIGPHVKNTSEIGVFRITSWTFEENTLRIRFKLASLQ